MNIKEFFTQLFTQLDTKDSWMIIGFLFISWLLGLIWGRLSYRRKYKKLLKQFKQKESDYNVLKAESDALQESYDLASADLKKANLELEALTTKAKTLEEERVNLHNELYAANERIQGLETNQRSYQAEVEGLNNEVLNLRGQNSSLSTQIQTASTSQTVTDNISSNPATDDRLSTIERQLDLLINENKALKSSLDQFNTSAATTTGISTSMAASRSNAVNEQRIDLEDETIQIERDEEDIELEGDFITTSEVMEPGRSEKARMAIQAAIGSKIPRAAAADKDDLKLINGIGPFIEDKLNGIGIYTYQQISKFDENMISLITDAIQFFPGRIDRDDWVGQAKAKL